jgi:hypothetical protein
VIVDFAGEVNPITVVNDPPDLTALTVPSNGTVGTVVVVKADFTDQGVLDTHTATFDWGDGTTTSVAAGSPAPNSVQASHTYAVPGLFTVSLSLVDDDGGQAPPVSGAITVTSGSGDLTVVGTGSFESPRGALVADRDIFGKATLTIDCAIAVNGPIGTASLEMGTALQFRSTAITTVTSREGMVFCSGTGILNGAEATFTVIVADRPGGDRVRVRIARSSGKILYDSEPGRSFPAVPRRGLASGGFEVI